MKASRLTAAVLTAGALMFVGQFGYGSSSSASALMCPKVQSMTTDTRAAPRRVTKSYATLAEAAAAVGVPLTASRQVVMVTVLPTSVDTRVVATSDPCRMIGSLAKATDSSSWRWMPALPARISNSRFVSSARGSVTVEVKTNPSGEWHRYTATSNAMRWTSGA